MKQTTLTASLGNYLAVIYEVQSRCQEVRVTDVAQHLNVSKPSVCRAIQLLENRGLIEHSKFGPLYLSKEGVQTALTWFEKQYTLQTFMIDVLGLHTDDAAREARTLSPLISQNLVNKMQQLIGSNPQQTTVTNQEV